MEEAHSTNNIDQANAAAAFIQRWQGVSASELSTAQSFVRELSKLLGVPAPHPTPEQNYMFERPITFSHGDGSSSAGRIDCYLRGHFVLEAKKLKAGNHTRGFDDALLRARAQAEGYARALPAEEGRPPFLLVVDVGNVIELYSEFTRSGATYTPFPDPRSHRLPLASLADAAVRERLKSIWLDPDSLDPSRASARVTREVAGQLAELARSLELSGHRADHVAAFLTRSLFSMFAEDVDLLPKGSFLGLLQAHCEQPATLQQMLRVLWADMDRGGFSAALALQVLKFNGKLFKQHSQDGYSLLLSQEQIGRLIRAAQANWREVEPAIFGTLLERALSPTERHALGAHYTPRAYVERLVLPTVVEPLRADWANAQAAALVLAREAAGLSGKAQDAKQQAACAEVRRFHHQLCSTRVLDPACGSGNFLYVTLEHLKRLEGEVINQLDALGDTQALLGLEGETVTPKQLLGIELNERAAAMAELVLWIGYLQWHIRTRGNKAVAEPVVHDYGNIEHRDAVLAWQATGLAHDANGKSLSRWDGSTFKAHPVTGALVPDEAAQVPQWNYIKPTQATWPQADFIVGNPPFIGAKYMREALGDGYAQALRAAWPEVPESADFVMHWWSRAAALVAAGKARRFGLITTNSLRQTFNRRVVQAAMDGQAGSGARSAVDLMLSKAQKTKVSVETNLYSSYVGTKSAPGRPHPTAGKVVLVFAIPDHPWVDNANGAAVRIAMTVGEATPAPVMASEARQSMARGDVTGRLLSVTSEQTGEFGEVSVTLAETTGLIHADLSIGANVASAVALEANANISSPGVKLHGAGFIVTDQEADALGLGTVPGLERHIRDYRNGRDLTDSPRGVKVIDLFGLSAEQVRSKFPAVYQRLLERVKPEREQNNRATYRDHWWLFGEPRRELRPALVGLPRYIATVVTAKHRTFQFLAATILADDALICITSTDAFHLGVLSSRMHVIWALAVGGRLGVGNDPRYNKSRCFETFPFPDEDTGLSPELRQRIASLAEQIDAHRKRQQAAHAGLTLTGMYNVLEALREGRALTAKEKTVHEQGLVAVLKDLHDELDTAVLQAYGLEPGQGTDALLAHLVTLNAQRAAEEQQGRIRWLRPEFQNPDKSLLNQELPAKVQQGIDLDLAHENQSQIDSVSTGTSAAAVQPWPAALPEQVRAVAQVLASHASALTLADIEARFKARGAWKKSLPRILETLEALGRARREGEGWRG
ncbi:MAG: class I SAM-dependent DNA methyltransferase [Polaromonas sp.]|nr:class I SAM-dependent DNA methyltransferase [Polaromonas sp.]